MKKKLKFKVLFRGAFLFSWLVFAPNQSFGGLVNPELNGTFGEGCPGGLPYSSPSSTTPGYYFRMFGKDGQEKGGFFDGAGKWLGPALTPEATPPANAAYKVLTYVQLQCDPDAPIGQCYLQRSDPDDGSKTFLQFYYRIVPIFDGKMGSGKSEKNNIGAPILISCRAILDANQNYVAPPTPTPAATPEPTP